MLADTPTLSEADRRFVLVAVSSGQYYAAAARLAGQRAQHPMVKAYAASLIQHHDRANDELQAIVRGRGMQWREGTTADRQAVLDSLAALALDLFDFRFVEQVGIKDHEDELLAFNLASRGLDDAALRSWTARMLPMLQNHLVLARRLPVLAQARWPGRHGGCAPTGVARV